MRVLICGGGVIGASTAYFLSRRGIDVVVIERTGLACAASGKSGGFLAEDWCAGSPLDALARRSFALHGELAAELGGDWGYRRMTTFGGALTDRAHIHHQLSTTETTAQVHPGAFTQAMMRAAEARGARLRIGEVTGLLVQDGRARGAEVDGAPLAGDAVVIAMGPWSILASQWLRLPGVYGLKGHSLVFETPEAKPEALFLEYRESRGVSHAPEVFPRSDGTTYVCAISSESPLPVDPRAVAPDDGAIERLHAMCKRISPALASAKVLAAQACFRPVTQDGLPLIGPVAGLAGAYVASGHSVWGILNAPATGEAMAELIADGAARTVDLTPFRPDRLRAFDPARLGRTR